MKRWAIGLLLTSFQGIAGTDLAISSYEQALKSLKKAPVTVLTLAAEAKVHGQHLPLNTDALIARALARDLVKTTPAAVMPNLSIGWYPQFARFQLSGYSSQVAKSVMQETLQSLVQAGAQRLLILNFDVQNSSGLPVMQAMNEIAREHRIPMLMLSWYDFVTEDVQQLLSAPAGHADELETSLILYLHPELVNQERLIDAPLIGPRAFAPPGGFSPTVFDPPERRSAFSIPGQLGSSKKANAQLGEKAYRLILQNITTRLNQLSEIRFEKN